VCSSDLYSVVGFREIPTYVTKTTYTPITGEMLDEIASRREFYGVGNEPEYYKIFEHNKVKIVENGFSIDKIVGLGIPVQ